MSTEFFNDQWRIPSNENQNKVSNYSMDFDGSSTKIDLGSTIGNIGVSSTTISFWLNIPTSTSHQTVLSNRGSGGGWAIDMFDNAGQYTISFFNASSSTSIRCGFSDFNTWAHIVFVRDGIANNKIYINGVSQTLTTNNENLTNIISSKTLTIGAQDPLSTGYYRFLNGKIDQVSIFDYALSQDQVTQLGAEGYAFNFIPNDYINLGDSNDFSFGNGTTDSPFSISAWVNMTDATSFVTIAKDATSNREYVIRTLSDDKLYFYLLDNVNGGYIGRISSGTVTSYQGTWIHTVYTYNGNSSSSGIKIYLNGSPVDNTNYQGGSYTAMSNTTTSLNIGRQELASKYANGEISNAAILNTELTGPQVATLYNSGKPLTDMSSFTSLQGWWKLDDTATFNSGTSVWSIPDDSSNSNTGTSVGMNASNLVASNINGELIANPMITSPKPIAYYQLGDQSVSTGPTSDYLVPNNSLSDYVFNFQGGTDRINLPASVSIGSQSTISMWVNLTGSYNYALLGESTYGSSTSKYTLFIDTAKLYFRIGTGYVQFIKSSKITSGNWHHILITRDGNSVKLWIDNQLEGTTSSWTGTNAGTQSTRFDRIGARHGSNLNSTVGKISNVAGWNQILTDSEITEVYNNGEPNDISSLSPTAWYKLNAADTFDGTDWTINDYGSGGNDGTSSGMDSANLVVSDLQQTSGYSPYALSLDGINDALTIQNSSTFNLGTAFTISGWFNFGSNKYQGLISFDATSGGSPRGWFLFQISSSNDVRLFDGTNIFTLKTSYTTTNQWDSFIITYDGTDLVFYINGNQESTQAVSVNLQTNGNDAQIGNNQFASGRFFDGKMSNIAFWNVGLTSTQVTEIYNEGVPSNLNNFSGTAPVAWWQLGSNSSFNTNWTCLDEIGSNNAVSAGNMTNDDIVDGPGYSASGLGTSSIDIKGDAPYSTANGLSENMDVLDRTTDVPS